MAEENKMLNGENPEGTENPEGKENPEGNTNDEPKTGKNTSKGKAEKNAKAEENVKVRRGLYTEEKYKVTVPLSEKDDSDLTIIVNGKTYKIQRGVEVVMPRAVYEVYQNMLRMDTLALKRRRALEEAYKNNK